MLLIFTIAPFPENYKKRGFLACHLAVDGKIQWVKDYRTRSIAKKGERRSKTAMHQM